VSAEPGTTRDYLVRRLNFGDVSIDLVDTAGWHEAVNLIECQSQNLGGDAARRADLLLVCREAGGESDIEQDRFPCCFASATTLMVATKCDLAPPAEGQIFTSARNAIGIEALRQLVAEHARRHRSIALAPSLSRCRHHLEACEDQLQQAHGLASKAAPAEWLALTLRSAVDELGALVGAVYTDDLLDRVFSRFCIGK
jgi:tRNA modification GTPase